MLEDHTIHELLFEEEENVGILDEYLCAQCKKVMPTDEYSASKARGGMCYVCFWLDKVQRTANAVRDKKLAAAAKAEAREAALADEIEKHGRYAAGSAWRLNKQLAVRRTYLVRVLRKRTRELVVLENKETRKVKREAAEARRAEHAAWKESNPPRTCKKCGITKRLSDFKDCQGFVCKKCRNKEKHERDKERRRREALPVKVLTPDELVAKEKLRREKHKALKKKYRADPMHRINRNFSQVIRNHFRLFRSEKPLGGWKAVVGYALQDLKVHLERQFSDGMSWDNYGEWHIDHIRPKASFSFSSADDQQFQDCWALSNLQPLWAVDNCKKGCKYVEEE